MILTIRDFETEEDVATIDENANISADDPMVEDDLDILLGPNREAWFRYSTTKETEEEGDPIIEERELMVRPGEKGYLVAVSENLATPYTVNWDESSVEALETPDPEEREPEVEYD